MEYTHILIHYSEIGLKGKNRSFFEKKLEHNIKRSLNREEVSFDSINRKRGRILVKKDKDTNIDKVLKTFKNIPGIANISPVITVKSDLEKIKETVLNILNNKNFSSFAIDTKRSYKEFPKTSVEINEELGSVVLEEFNKRVDLDNPELTVYVELTKSKTYI